MVRDIPPYGFVDRLYVKQHSAAMFGWSLSTMLNSTGSQAMNGCAGTAVPCSMLRDATKQFEMLI
jgi:hypothetical protein